MAHVARKRFGQHFLSDRSVIEAILAAISPRPGERLVEIGPGLAALTDALLRRVPTLAAIEIDRDLAASLRRRYGERLALVEADVLTVDFRPLASEGPLRIVGNLPYNISSPLLVRLIDFRDCVVDQHFMLQKEVVERIVSGHGGSGYGRLGVLLQAYYDVESLFDVPPEAFDPPPRVDSAVVRMLPKARPADVPPAVLSELLAAAFSQRRKMLRGTLLPWLAARGVRAEMLEPTARPEDVPVEVYVELAGRLRSMSSSL
ncbi:MAG TPA: 16S rRNA (adenine(1518)-N(6)/adenine(1519)-N(6))-dimethyltransferase RsmA [Quisquiliibacterium sp.]|nr:16S rRNA (adenine(1518)-N(6)/adenine(1519)-N(6))-dimethyltransferase RsmA [Quisquiliibacterium sp.]